LTSKFFHKLEILILTDMGGRRKKKNKWGQIKRITLKRVKILRERLEKIFFAGAGTLASPLASATAYRLRLIVTFLGGKEEGEVNTLLLIKILNQCWKKKKECLLK
jgi:hypothetical protein